MHLILRIILVASIAIVTGVIGATVGHYMGLSRELSTVFGVALNLMLLIPALGFMNFVDNRGQDKQG